MNNVCIHFFVSGKVQGVWFRANTQKKAQTLNLTGWVKNLSDGRVEVLACGEKTAVEQLHDWLWQGPELAKVTQVESFAETLQNFTSFEIV